MHHAARGTYKQLNQPPLAPPGWVFGPVWTCLYLGMGVASHLAYKAGSRSPLYSVQLILNFLWMPLFFGGSYTKLALVDCAALTGCVGLLMQQWWKVDRRAVYLLAPYLAWTGFATYLTEEVGRRNNWDVLTPPSQRKGGKAQ